MNLMAHPDIKAINFAFNQNFTGSKILTMFHKDPAFSPVAGISCQHNSNIGTITAVFKTNLVWKSLMKCFLYPKYFAVTIQHRDPILAREPSIEANPNQDPKQSTFAILLTRRPQK